MREVCVRIRFVSASLGNVKAGDSSGRFFLPRNVQGSVQFLATWYAANARTASRVLGRHQDAVGGILWSDVVTTENTECRFYRRYYKTDGGRERYCVHEAFMPGDIVSFRAVVPAVISDQDLRELLDCAGRYCGLSPWKRIQGYGRYDVISISPSK